MENVWEMSRKMHGEILGNVWENVTANDWENVYTVVLLYWYTGILYQGQNFEK